MLKELFTKKSQTVNNALITLGDIDDSGKGKKFTSRFIQPGLVGYPNQFGTVLVKKETLDDSLKTIIGAPVIINHTKVTEVNADELRVGVISNAWYDDKDGWYWCDGVIWDETAQNLITDKKWSVSCSYDCLQEDNEGGTENNIPYDREFTKLNFVHLALVNNPRYERANIVFNSKTFNISNYSPSQPRIPKGNPNGGQFANKDGNISSKPKLRDYKTYLNKHKSMGLIEKYPADFLGTTDDEIADFLGIEENKPAVFHSPIETVKIYHNNIPHIRHETDKTRLLGLGRAIRTLQNPNIIIQDKKENYYIKFFDKSGKNKTHLQVIKTTKNGGFYKTNFPMSKSKFEKLEGQVIYDLSSKRGLTSKSIVTEVKNFFNPNVKEHEDMHVENQFIDAFYQAIEEVLYPNKVNNGWITLKDRVDEDGKPLRVFIPNYVPSGGAALDFHKKMVVKSGSNIDYEFERTRATISDEQKKHIESEVNKILNNYKVEPPLKGVNVCTIGGGCLGVAITSASTRTLSLDSKVFKDKGTEAFNRSVESGWLARTDADILTSVLTHELGHIITATSNNEKFWNRISEIKSEYVKNVAKDDIKNEDYISKYARTNKDEFVAECFAQGTLLKTPSKYAKMVVEEINTHFKLSAKENKQLRLFNALKEVLNMKDKKTTDDDIIWIESDGAGYCLTEEDYEKRKSEVEEYTKEQLEK